MRICLGRRILPEHPGLGESTSRIRSRKPREDDLRGSLQEWSPRGECLIASTAYNQKKTASRHPSNRKGNIVAGAQTIYVPKSFYTGVTLNTYTYAHSVIKLCIEKSFWKKEKSKYLYLGHFYTCTYNMLWTLKRIVKSSREIKKIFKFSTPRHL